MTPGNNGTPHGAEPGSTNDHRLFRLDFTGWGEQDVAANPSLGPATWYDEGNVQVPIISGQKMGYWSAQGDNRFGDGEPWNDFEPPEGVHRWDALLPEHEHHLLNDRGRCYHLFAPAKAWWSRFWLNAELEPGSYRLTLDLWGDWVDVVDGAKVPKPDPEHARVELFIGEQGREGWLRPSYHERSVLQKEFQVENAGQFGAGFGVLTVYAPGSSSSANGCFVRSFALERISAETPEQPSPGEEVEPAPTAAEEPEALFEVSRKMILQPEGVVIRALRLEVSSQENGRWEVARSVNERLEAGNRLEIVFLQAESDRLPIGDSEPIPETPPPVEREPEGFRFSIWPTVEKHVTQEFGARPEFYRRISDGFLPAHEGIDLSAPFGTPYYSVAPGTVVRVSDRRQNGEPSAYGWHVVVDHGSGYSTLYAHAMQERLPVQVGDQVAAGQILAHSGNTGNSSGPHLHLTLKQQGTRLEGWPPGYVDPWPFLEPLFNDLVPPMGALTEGYLFATSLELRGNQMALARLNLNLRELPDSSSRLIAVVPKGSKVRLLRDAPENRYYYCEVGLDESAQPKRVLDAPQQDTLDLLPYVKGDGRQYEVRNAWGSQERFQTQEDGSTFYLVKNAQWEQFFFDNDFIYRDVDTSPGGGRYYRLTDADRQRGSRWLRRRMAIGGTYSQSRHVQFYMKADGAPSAANSGHVTDTIQLVARHDRHRFQTGIEVEDVLELLWVNGGEKYYYARGFGLVGWAREHEDPNSPSWSAVSEIHAPGAREPFARERVTIR